jgi:hypothetical protein
MSWMRFLSSLSKLVKRSLRSLSKLVKRSLTRVQHAITPTVILNVPKDQPSTIHARFTLSSGRGIGDNLFTCYISGTGLKESGRNWSLGLSLPTVGNYYTSDSVSISNDDTTITPRVAVSSFEFQFGGWTIGKWELVSAVGATFAVTFPELDVYYSTRSDDHFFRQRVSPDISVTSEFDPPDTDDVIDAGIQPSNLNAPPSASNLNVPPSDSGSTWVWPTVHANAAATIPSALGIWEPIYYAVPGVQIPSAHSVSGQAAENVAQFNSGIFLGLSGAALIGSLQEFVNQLWRGRRRKVSIHAA